MLHFDELIEKLADWFMDFFLDPVYVLETTNGMIEVISMPNIVNEPVLTLESVSKESPSEKGFSAIPLVEILLTIVTASVKSTTTLYRVIANWYNTISMRYAMFNTVKPNSNFDVGYTNWLTG